MKLIYVIRHGQTEWNVEQRMQGRLDSALTDTGKAQASAHGKLIRQLGGVDHIVASPSGRTRETASLINAHLNAPLDYDEMLMERDCGEWSGLTVAEIAAEYPAEWDAREADAYFHRPPGGENLPDMIERVLPLTRELDGIEEGTLALITHGVMSRALLTHYLELNPVASVRVRHPNDLFYCLRFADNGVWPEFYRNGEGPVAGLLRTMPDETIRMREDAKSE